MPCLFPCGAPLGVLHRVLPCALFKRYDDFVCHIFNMEVYHEGFTPPHAPWGWEGVMSCEAIGRQSMGRHRGIGRAIELPYRALFHILLMSIFQAKVKISKKTIKITIRKCVQERKIDPSPTHYSKFHKHIVKKPKIEIGIN